MAAGHSALECPIHRPESNARISERRPEFNGGGPAGLTAYRANRPVCWKMLGMRGCNLCAIAAPHQHAILGPAQVGDAHDQPYSDRCQGDGEGEARDIGQHALAKVVRFLAVLLVAREVIRFRLSVFLRGLLAQFFPSGRRVGRSARPELEHAMLVVRSDGLLGFY
jgi:hypothetical protein